MSFNSFDQKKILSLFKSLQIYCSNTGQNRAPSFGDEFSFIYPSSSNIQVKSYKFLCLDIGGTRSKVCLKTKLPDSEPAWTEILDIDNNDLKVQSSGKGLEVMSLELSNKIKTVLQSKQIPTDFDGIAIVWSNKIQSFLLAPPAKGVGAKVYGSKDGQAYRKGEWWNSDIEDGDDISSYFINSFKRCDISFKSLVISNDTVFTAKALKGASAGVVASTGANTTIIPISDSNQFYNSECGGKIVINKDNLNLINCDARLPLSELEIKIEDVCAGRGIPQIYHLYIKDLIASGYSELTEFEQKLSSHPLTAPQLSKILQDESFACVPDYVNPASENLAIQTLKNSIEQAGAYCALLIFISVSNQIGTKKELTVALDSSQARNVKGYVESLDKNLLFLNQQLSSKVSYRLLAPDGKISVPLQGAANSLEDFLS